jgi:hypothetical protein
MNLKAPVASEYRADLIFGGSVVMLFQVFAGCCMDGGVLFRDVSATTLAYCGVLTIIFCRRQSRPTAIDLWLIRGGFVLLFLIVPPALRLGWHLRGLA